ncbi:MAG: vitamin K epoxide reductase family protein [Bowdeniella nasicola]|nr:vitamin K epoxide reductase family protein [Bowdeniella nasicola]
MSAKRTRAKAASSIGGALQYALVLTIASLGGLVSSGALLHAELDHLANPGEVAMCDLNSLVGCGTSLLSPQAHLLFGLPNAMVGLVVFAMATTVGLLLLSGIALPRWMWWVLSLGSLGGIGFVAWFAYQSIAVFHTLCPYCMIVWLMTIPIAIFTLARACATGQVPGRSLGIHVWTFRWLYAFGAVMAIALVVVIGMRHEIAALL